MRARRRPGSRWPQRHPLRATEPAKEPLIKFHYALSFPSGVRRGGLLVAGVRTGLRRWSGRSDGPARLSKHHAISENAVALLRPDQPNARRQASALEFTEGPVLR